MEENLPIDGRQARKAANCDKLIQTAFQLLEVRGIYGLTVRGLAEEAQMAPATIYNLFGSKAGLLTSMLKGLPEHGPSLDLDHADCDPLNAVLKFIDHISIEWTKPDSPISALVLANRRQGAIAPLLLPSVQNQLTFIVVRFFELGWISDEIPSSTLANRIAYANAGLFDAWLEGAVSTEVVWSEHRMNFLLPVLTAAKDSKRMSIKAAIEETLAAVTDGNMD